MKEAIKKEIKQSVKTAMTGLLDELHISKPSKKTVQAVSKTSKALNKDIQDSVKKEAKKAKKEAKKINKAQRKDVPPTK